MATRARIAIKIPGGYKSVYSHWDGYPEGVGAILKKYYKNPAKVKKLISLGDISILGPLVGVKHPFSNYDKKGMSYDDWKKRYGNMTTYYGRDRGEKNVGAKTSRTFEQLGVTADRAGGAEYLYVFSNGRWKAYEFVFSTKEWKPVKSYNGRTIVRRMKVAKRKVIKKSPIRKKRVVRRTTTQTGRTNLIRDRKLRAKAPGKRKSKSGKTYYERRRNRSDVKGIDLPKRKRRVKKK